jgi:twitching motility protein PilT
MVAAFEIMVANNPVRNLIREGKTNQLLNVITTSQQEGMCTMEHSLADLIRTDTVTYDDAMTISAHPKELDRLLNHHRAMLSTA